MTTLGVPVPSSWTAATHLRWLERARQYVAGADFPERERLALHVDRATVLLELGEESGWAQARLVDAGTVTSSTALQRARGSLNLGNCAMRWGRYAEARRRLTAAVDLGTRHGHQRIADMAVVTLVHLDHLGGDWQGLAERAATWLAADDEPLFRLDTLYVTTAQRIAARGGTLYVTGGWHGAAGASEPQSTVYAYHPVSDTWTRVADLPTPLAMASAAVYDGKLYVIGGSTDGGNHVTSAVHRYDPATNRWARVADYPTTVASSACEGLSNGVVCAGGDTRDAGGHTVGLATTYTYDPHANTWTRNADMPYTDWGASSSAGNGELQVVGGIVGAEGTNQALQYDPVTGHWSHLPNAAYPVFRGGGSGCGLTQVGGAIADGLSFPSGNRQAETLPGYGSCAQDDATWLSANKQSVEIAPGRSVTVRVTVDSAALGAPGGYAADLSLITDTPYAPAPLSVTTKVTAPASWSHLSGRVTTAATGDALRGATVTLCPAGHATCPHPTATVATDSRGGYDLWLRPAPGRYTVTATADGFLAAGREVKLTRGSRTTADLALRTS